MKYVLIHGAWHRGELFEAVAAPVRDAGHEVLLPTLYGNGINDPGTLALKPLSVIWLLTLNPTMYPMQWWLATVTRA